MNDARWIYDEIIESLYDLSGDELRSLAYEVLLISDGPDASNHPTATSAHRVDWMSGDYGPYFVIRLARETGSR